MRRDHPQTQLQMADLDIGRARLILKARLDTLALLADPLTGTDYDNDATSRNGHSDPTPAQAELLERWHQMQTDIGDTCKELAAKALHLNTLLNAVPTFVELAGLYRCTGGMGMEGCDEWGDEQCQQVMAYERGHNAGLCANHVRYRNRWEAKQQVA